MLPEPCVTANLQWGRMADTRKWFRWALGKRPVMVFGQEFRHEQWLGELAEEFGYAIHRPSSPQPELRAMGSWVMTRADIVTRPLFSIHKPYTDWFGAYVAGVRVSWPALKDDVAVFSIHASPRSVPLDHLRKWPTNRPPSRLTADAVLRELYYVDLMLALLSAVSETCHVVAAGDFNEARSRVPNGAWLLEKHRFGEEFFARAAELGFVDVTYRDWGEERRTLFKPNTAGFQSDHILATSDVAHLLSMPVVDPAWASPSARKRHADHAPVWFKAALQPS